MDIRCFKVLRFLFAQVRLKCAVVDTRCVFLRPDFFCFSIPPVQVGVGGAAPVQVRLALRFGCSGIRTSIDVGGKERTSQGDLVINTDIDIYTII